MLISVHLVDGTSVGVTITLDVRDPSEVPDSFKRFATHACTHGLLATEGGALTFYPAARIARMVLSSAYIGNAT